MLHNSKSRSLDNITAIAVVRIPDATKFPQIAAAISAGGLRHIEITVTSPHALQPFSDAAELCSDAVLGVGSVLDAATARLAILAGAQFIVTPTVELDVLEVAHRYGIPAIIGAMTPTEILTAWEAGAAMVKVFPASLLGPRFLQEVHGPLPQVSLVPTGGITADNAGEFIRAGAAAVCVGSWLIDRKSLADGRYDAITEKARRLVKVVQAAREEVT